MGEFAHSRPNVALDAMEHRDAVTSTTQETCCSNFGHGPRRSSRSREGGVRGELFLLGVPWGVRWDVPWGVPCHTRAAARDSVREAAYFEVRDVLSHARTAHELNPPVRGAAYFGR